jgi:hypothetical protein
MDVGQEIVPRTIILRTPQPQSGKGADGNASKKDGNGAKNLVSYFSVDQLCDELLLSGEPQNETENFIPLSNSTEILFSGPGHESYFSSTPLADLQPSEYPSETKSDANIMPVTLQDMYMDNRYSVNYNFYTIRIALLMTP